MITNGQARDLINHAGRHRVPLRVPPDCYADLQELGERTAIERAALGAPVFPWHGEVAGHTGTPVIIVHDGTANVVLIDGVWTFAPPEPAPPDSEIHWTIEQWSGSIVYPGSGKENRS